MTFAVAAAAVVAAVSGHIMATRDRIAAGMAAEKQRMADELAAKERLAEKLAEQQRLSDEDRSKAKEAAEPARDLHLIDRTKFIHYEREKHWNDAPFQDPRRWR